MKTHLQAEGTVAAAMPTRDRRKIPTRTPRTRDAFRLIPIDLSGTIGTFGQRLRLKELGLRSYPRRPEERKGGSLIEKATTLPVGRRVLGLRALGLEEILIPDRDATGMRPRSQIVVPHVAGGVFDLQVTGDRHLRRARLRMFERVPSAFPPVLRGAFMLDMFESVPSDLEAFARMPGVPFVLDCTREVRGLPLFEDLQFEVGIYKGHVWASCVGAGRSQLRETLELLAYVAGIAREWGCFLPPGGFLTDDRLRDLVDLAFRLACESKRGRSRLDPIMQVPETQHRRLALPPASDES